MYGVRFCKLLFYKIKIFYSDYLTKASSLQSQLQWSFFNRMELNIRNNQDFFLFHYLFNNDIYSITNNNHKASLRLR